MAWITFGGLTGDSVGAIDAQNLTLAQMASIPVTVSGSNALQLTGIISGLGFSSYQNYMTFCGVATATNSAAATAFFGSLPALSIFKDTTLGPVVLTGGEIVDNNALWLTYDSSLDGGNGGFHLLTGPSTLLALYLPLAGGNMTGKLGAPSMALPAAAPSSITSILSGGASLAYTALVPGASLDQSITISGVSVSDVVALGTPAAPLAGVGYTAFVSAPDIVTVRAFNYHPSSTFTPGGGTYRATAFRSLP